VTAAGDGGACSARSMVRELTVPRAQYSLAALLLAGCCQLEQMVAFTNTRCFRGLLKRWRRPALFQDGIADDDLVGQRRVVRGNSVLWRRSDCTSVPPFPPMIEVLLWKFPLKGLVVTLLLAVVGQFSGRT
jgi:hypothetical protein